MVAAAAAEGTSCNYILMNALFGEIYYSFPHDGFKWLWSKVGCT